MTSIHTLLTDGGSLELTRHEDSGNIYLRIPKTGDEKFDAVIEIDPDILRRTIDAVLAEGETPAPEVVLAENGAVCCPVCGSSDVFMRSEGIEYYDVYGWRQTSYAAEISVKGQMTEVTQTPVCGNQTCLTELSLPDGAEFEF